MKYDREYQKQYKKSNPEWVIYYSIINLVKKAAVRVRDNEYGFRQAPLRDSDIQLREAVKTKLKEGMTWKNYGIVWHLTHPKLIKKVREGITLAELLKPECYEPVFKSTNNIDKNKI